MCWELLERLLTNKGEIRDRSTVLSCEHCRPCLANVNMLTCRMNVNMKNWNSRDRLYYRIYRQLLSGPILCVCVCVCVFQASEGKRE